MPQVVSFDVAGAGGHVGERQDEEEIGVEGNAGFEEGRSRSNSEASSVYSELREQVTQSHLIKMCNCVSAVCWHIMLDRIQENVTIDLLDYVV